MGSVGPGGLPTSCCHTSLYSISASYASGVTNVEYSSREPRYTRSAAHSTLSPSWASLDSTILPSLLTIGVRSPQSSSSPPTRTPELAIVSITARCLMPGACLSILCISSRCQPRMSAMRSFGGNAPYMRLHGTPMPFMSSSFLSGAK